MDIITRQNKTADGLRNRLFDLLDSVIEGKADFKRVEATCAISEQIMRSAKLELDIVTESSRIKIDESIEERRLIEARNKSVAMIANIIDEDKDVS